MIIPIDDTARALLDADSLRGYPDKIDIPDQTYGEIEGRLLRQHPEQDAEDRKWQTVRNYLWTHHYHLRAVNPNGTPKERVTVKAVEIPPAVPAVAGDAISNADRSWFKRWAISVLVMLGLILLAILLSASRAHAQWSQIGTITFEDTTPTIIKTFAAPFRIQCGVNITCTYTTDANGNTVLNFASAGGGAVGSFSGDGSLLSNSLSVGAVTATLANAGANKWWGNNTGSSTAPGYQSIGSADTSPNWYVAAGGTHDAQTATLVPAVPALATGLVVNFLPVASNTGTTPTLAVNGLAAKTITKCGQSALVAGDLSTTAIASVFYDGTDFELLNPQVNGCGGATQLNDSNGKSEILTTATASAVDQVTVTNSATANPATVSIYATGSDNNVSLNLGGKGTGVTQFGNFGNTTNGLQLASNGTFNRYLNVPLAGGPGLAVVDGVSNVTNQTASQTTVNLLASGSVAAGGYRINYYADEKTACSTVSAGGVTFTFGWTDGTLARTFTTSSLNADTSDVAADYIQGSVDIQSAVSVAITYISTYTATCSTGGPFAYDFHASLERTQ
jgi:hypothetical protein